MKVIHPVSILLLTMVQPLAGNSQSNITLTHEVIRFYQDGFAGYKNKSSNEIIVPARYVAGSEMLYSTDGNYAIVIENQKRGYINAEGEIIVPLIYEDASPFYEGLAAVRKNGKYGFINIKGETIITFQFDLASGFKDGLARIQKNSRWGYIGSNGNAIIALKFLQAGDFSDGLAAVLTTNGQWGYINSEGNFAFPPTYEQAQEFENGEALVKKNGALFFIDKTGKELREVKQEEDEEHIVDSPNGVH